MQRLERSEKGWDVQAVTGVHTFGKVWLGLLILQTWVSHFPPSALAILSTYRDADGVLVSFSSTSTTDEAHRAPRCRRSTRPRSTQRRGSHERQRCRSAFPRERSPSRLPTRRRGGRLSVAQRLWPGGF
ncbi:hypothetical protein SCHPADRAFT_622868 [Schizopora paradoxa]|uniref:Uncharacterized protein n=1 Tax=Schizopora paradoxa TaxID=27342 RepID=A0A0H2R9J1_9AGAM|nr:hypothetical protein SCHPADRAFT_622868 [Schizopora paradoxa]